MGYEVLGGWDGCSFEIPDFSKHKNPHCSAMTVGIFYIHEHLLSHLVFFHDFIHFLGNLSGQLDVGRIGSLDGQDIACGGRNGTGVYLTVGDEDEEIAVNLVQIAVIDCVVPFACIFYADLMNSLIAGTIHWDNLPIVILLLGQGCPVPHLYLAGGSDVFHLAPV